MAEEALWKVGCDDDSKRRWFIHRGGVPPEDARGRCRRFGSADAAALAAEELNTGVPGSFLKTSKRYLDRLHKGDRIMRDSTGAMRWSSGKSVGAKTIRHMLDQGQIRELDTDLFGDRSRGQTLGLA